MYSKLYLKSLSLIVKDMQANVNSVIDIRKCVVDQMVADRAKLGQLFMKCGKMELQFLTNSGLWFGFILGLIQMLVALFVSNPWSLSIGGLIVGFATNWLALKWIFCPVNPTKILGFGPFQGLFLTRQKEVAKEFSSFFANNILTSEQLWNSMLTTEETREAFIKIIAKRVGGSIPLATSVANELPKHLNRIHPYVDKTLALRPTLKSSMEKMTPLQFERVLHPIFEEDELTLIIAGAVLGFLAGLVQQGLATGSIKLTKFGWFMSSKGKTEPPIGGEGTT